MAKNKNLITLKMIPFSPSQTVVRVPTPTRMLTAIAARRSTKDTMRLSIASSVPLLSAKAADTRQESSQSHWI
jgi:hypothetical protein